MGAAPAGFTALRQRKDRSVYFAALKNGDTENWFGPVISSAPTDLALVSQLVRSYQERLASARPEQETVR